jgi:DNA mismatch endonuclease, patch repair protein
VHGCFWHAHHCRYGLAVPKSNMEFWQDKFAKNTTRDRLVNRKLKELGWQVHIVWECDVKRGSWLEKTLAFLES